jgi:parallel beta-helix repeat protein
MSDLHANFSYSNVVTAPSPATSGTSLATTNGDGAKFPVTPFNATIWPSGVSPVSTNAEIVRVTGISTDTFTIVRAQEGTSAISIAIGYQIAATVTKKTLTDIESQRVASATVSTGSVLADYIGNGSSDETAFNSALSATTGTILVRAGTYHTGSAHILPLSNNVLAGEGKATNIILAATKVIKVDQQNGVVIRDLAVDASANSSINSYTIYIDRSNDVTVKDVLINWTFAYGIFVTNQTAGTTVSRFRFINNRIIGACNNDLIGGGPGTDTAHVAEIMVHNNFIQQDATLTGAGTYLNALDIVAQEKAIITNNITYGGILLGGEKIPHFNVDVIGNIVNAPVGISSTIAVGQIAILCASNTAPQQSADSYGVNIIGNQITSGNIFVQGQSATSNRTRDIKISNNYVSNNSSATYADHTYGINLNYVANVKIYGNTVKNAVRGISLTNTDGVDISNNDFLNCTTPISLNGSNTNLTGHNNVGINPDILYAQGNVTGGTTLDRANGIHITATLTGNITVTLANTYFKGERLILELTQDGTGNRTATWPSNFKKAAGSLTLSTAAGATDIIEMSWDGTNWVEVGRTLNIS